MLPLLILAFSFVCQDLQEPRVQCILEPRNLYVGEAADYTVEALNFEVSGPPELHWPGIRVEYLGEQRLNSRSTVIINGQRQDTSKVGMQFRYRLTPLKEGIFDLSGPEFIDEGETRVGNRQRLQAIAPEPQNVLLLKVETSHQEVYPLQAFQISLEILVRELPGEYRNRDPLAPLREAPVLQVPWADIPEGLKAEDLDRWLGKYRRSRDIGFSINNFTVGNNFSFFGNRRAIFQLPGEWQQLETPLEGRFRSYRLERSFIPLKPGRYPFGPANLKGVFGTADQNGQLIGKQLYALSNTVSVHVRDVPEQGRPAGYSGAIGQFSAKAEILPKKAQVGDPLTLNLIIRGQGNLADILPLDLEQVLPSLKQDFKFYDATSETRAQRKIITYSLRPLRAGITEFPAIPFAYFDPEKGAFVEAPTETLPLSIRKAEALAAEDVVVAPAGDGGKRAIEAAESGYVANFSDTERLLQRRLTWTSVATYCAALVTLWALLAGFLGRQRRLKQNPDKLRRSKAPARAQQGFQAVKPSLAGGDRQACADLALVFRTLFADWEGLDAASLGTGDVIHMARQAGFDRDLCHRLESILSRCDAARYGAGAEATADLGQEAEAVLQGLLQQGAGNGSKAARGWWLLLLLPVIGSCRQAADPDLARRFQQIQSDFLSADEAASYSAVASQLEVLALEHPDSGPLWYNLGNAWALAGQTGRAVAAYRRAQRLLPGDPYVENNLQTAQGSAPSFDGDQRGLREHFLFWKRWFGQVELAWATVFAATFWFLFAVIRLMDRRRKAWIWATRLSLALCLVAAGNGLFLLWQEQPGNFGVIVEDEVIAYQGNSESYERAFTENLQQATEFQLLESRSGWLHIRLPRQGPEGWIRQNQAELY
ncbi:MAG: hypothetical protein DWQ01_20325 [Planctomycetota bacterium]|nr:MAG: hypothetical protein DWQ01_20325 [Planctomycetota bacterium]